MMPLTDWRTRTANNESGFTLIELLVVVLIIGILAAIAIPMFLNQRQAANDASVESDVRTAATTIETLLIRTPNPRVETFTGSGSEGSAVIELSGLSSTVQLSEGVSLTTAGIENSNGIMTGYRVCATHTNGGQYNEDDDQWLVYDSEQGGLQEGSSTASDGCGPMDSTPGNGEGGDHTATPASCFMLSSGTGTIEHYLRGRDECGTDVVIPSEIDGSIVRHIGMNAFGSNNLSSVTIPDSVTSIGASAFSSNNLSSVTIPDSVTSIGNFAFAYNNLSSVTIGSSVGTIEFGAFMENNLTSVIIPNSVTSIEDHAFRDNNLTSVELPADTTYVESGFNSSFDSSVTVTGGINIG